MEDICPECIGEGCEVCEEQKNTSGKQEAGLGASRPLHTFHLQAQGSGNVPFDANLQLFGNDTNEIPLREEAPNLEEIRRRVDLELDAPTGDRGDF